MYPYAKINLILIQWQQIGVPSHSRFAKFHLPYIAYLYTLNNTNK